MDKLRNVEAAGWALLLKVLILMHISGVDRDYVEGVKQWIRKAVKSGNCGNEDICCFAYDIIDHITPLRPKRRTTGQKIEPALDEVISATPIYPLIPPFL
jgi:hypothetical protein